MTTTTDAPLDKGHALVGLADAVQTYRDARTALDVATRHRDEAIRQAVKAGASIPDVAERAGVARTRIYQVLGS